MSEWFIEGNTFAAPFVSESISRYVEAETPEEALEKLSAEMEKGVGLYSAAAYASADDYHKGRTARATWWSNHALALKNATSYRSDGPGILEIDGKRVRIKNPKKGTIT